MLMESVPLLMGMGSLCHIVSLAYCKIKMFYCIDLSFNLITLIDRD